MNIVLGFDGEPASLQAIRELRWAGLPEAGSLTVASFADIMVPPGVGREDLVADPEMPAPVRECREAARRLWDRAQMTAETGAAEAARRHPGWRVEAVSGANSPAWGLLEVARSREADLIVTGSHNRGPLARFFLGSAAQKVAGEAGCSVRIVRGGGGRTAAATQLVAVDGSEGSREMVARVAGRNWGEAAHFHVVGVVDSQLETAVLCGGGQGEGFRQPLDWLEEALQRAREALEGAGLAVEVHRLLGDPKRLLVTFAEETDAACLFMGASGLRPGERRGLGTVATAVAARAHCTVEIVR